MRHCTICSRSDRPVFDARILAGVESLRSIAGQLGCSLSTIQRHRDHHISRGQVVESESAKIWRRIDERQKLIEADIERAQGDGCHAAVMAGREAQRKLDEMRLRRMGDLEPRPGEPLPGDTAPRDGFDWLNRETAGEA